MKILAYIETQAGEITSGSQELVAGARDLAGDDGKVAVVLVGPAIHAAKALGADQVFTVPGLADAPYNPVDHGATVAEAVAQYAPDLVLINYTTAGLDIGPRLAMQKRLPLFAYCLSASVDGNSVKVESQIYGGKLTTSATTELPAMLMINAGTFASVDVPPSREATVTELTVEQTSGLRFVSASAPDPSAVDITKSDNLLCVGRGIGDEDVITEVRKTAALIGAELVGSRPVIDLGWLPKERQVGKSGRKVKPKVYLALGVSGAPEHIEGMGTSDLIIAVNTDENAPIFEYAHFGSTVDLKDFLPAFHESLGKEADRS